MVYEPRTDKVEIIEMYEDYFKNDNFVEDAEFLLEVEIDCPAK